jgi:hypothetical protein
VNAAKTAQTAARQVAVKSATWLESIETARGPLAALPPGVFHSALRSQKCKTERPVSVHFEAIA